MKATPDKFFTAEQQARLAELMIRRRAANKTLPAPEQVELESLVEAEVAASGERAAALRLSQKDTG